MDGDSYAVRSECEHSDTTDMIICLCKGGGGGGGLACSVNLLDGHTTVQEM